MRSLFITLGFVLALAMVLPGSAAEKKAKSRKLRHVVALKFKEGTTQDQIASIEKAFRDLKKKIPQISNLEAGLNNSPEHRNKGFTHAFILTFKSEKDRDAYLIDPAHQEFGKLLGPHLDDVLVIDFWAKH